MSNTNTGGPAFPQFVLSNGGACVEGGMTLRQYAAIHLKVPNSGTDWLDEMIVESNRNELATKAMQLATGKHMTNDRISAEAYELADAMLKACEQ